MKNIHQPQKNIEIKAKTRAVKTSTPFFAPTPVIQKKLSVGAVNDVHEIEADSMADKVMRMYEPSQQNVIHTGPLVQRKCATCEEEGKVQRKPLAENITTLIQRSSTESKGDSHASSHVENQINASRGRGSLMNNGTKNFMESRFGSDFSDVKIHTDSQAIQMSRELNAQAFTVGNDVYFNEGKYSPNSDSGKRLLAHELTHTVQQAGRVERKIQKNDEAESTTGGLCLKSIFGGEVYFDGLSTSELNNIAVINEDDNSGTVHPPVNGLWYDCDGFWFNGYTDWFKIPDHCKVEVFSSPARRIGFYNSCCNIAASIFRNGPGWSNDGLDDSKSNPFV